MLSYCLKSRKNTESKVVKTKHGWIMLLSKCTLCDSEKSKFFREEEARGSCGTLGIKIP